MKIIAKVRYIDFQKRSHTELHWVSFYHYVRHFCTKGKRPHRREMIDADIRSSLGIDKFGEIEEILEKLNSIWWYVSQKVFENIGFQSIVYPIIFFKIFYPLMVFARVAAIIIH